MGYVASVWPYIICQACWQRPNDAGPYTQEARNLSAHERRMQRMAERARKLEAQNVGDKEWFMRGEADSGLCPLLADWAASIDCANQSGPLG